MIRKRFIIVSLFIILLLAIFQDQYFKPDFVYIKGSDTVDIIAENADGKININTASENLLTTLDGIGEGLAKRIIEYRTSAPFKDINDIMNVSGIGEKKFDAIKDKIKVK